MPRLFAIFGALFAALLPAAPALGQALPRSVAERAEAAGIPPDAIGVVVRRVSDGREVLAHRARESMPPASTLKLLTSQVALERLGPTWRGRTELLVRGEVREGVLRGDVYLRGFADVDFGWRELETFLRRLKLRGIREIDGDLVLDRNFFQPARMDIGVPPFDESPEFRYNVIPDALALNMNLVDLDLLSVDDTVRVASSPPLEGIAFESRMTLADGRCEDWEDLWKLPAVERSRGNGTRVRLQGAFPRDCAAATAINVIPPERFADALFRSLWKGMGGRFAGRVREGSTPPEARKVSEHQSRFLSQVVRDVNKRSDNPVTRMLFLTLGATLGEGEGTTAVRADAVVRRWLAERGLDSSSLVLENGSGLSRRERISPDLLASVLQLARTSAWAPEFEASLPIAAVDGGMRNRLTQSPAAARARLKTGTLRDVSAVAGYVQDVRGETHVVVAMIHHDRAVKQAARPVLDAIVDWVAKGAAGS